MSARSPIDLMISALAGREAGEVILTRMDLAQRSKVGKHICPTTFFINAFAAGIAPLMENLVKEKGKEETTILMAALAAETITGMMVAIGGEAKAQRKPGAVNADAVKADKAASAALDALLELVKSKKGGG